MGASLVPQPPKPSINVSSLTRPPAIGQPMAPPPGGADIAAPSEQELQPPNPNAAGMSPPPPSLSAPSAGAIPLRPPMTGGLTPFTPPPTLTGTPAPAPGGLTGVPAAPPGGLTGSPAPGAGQNSFLQFLLQHRAKGAMPQGPSPLSSILHRNGPPSGTPFGGDWMAKFRARGQAPAAPAAPPIAGVGGIGGSGYHNR